MGHVFSCFQTYFWSHQSPTGVFGALLTDCRNSNADLTIQSHHVVSPRIWNPAPCCSDLLLLSWSYVSSPHPWALTASCISCKQAFGGGGVSTRLDASSPGMTWQWPQSAWHQNSLTGHTLSTTSAHGQHPVQQCTQDGSLITSNANITMGGDAVWEAITEPFHHSEQVHGVGVMPVGKLQTTFLQTLATYFLT